MACGGDGTSPPDAPIDAATDAATDAGSDAATDAGTDAAIDAAAIDAATDAAAIDAAAIDAASDAQMDAATDAQIDAAIAPQIVEPPDGTELRARRQVFAWTATGSNYHLRIGTSPGAADIYASPPLGDATSVTVDGLPLSGTTLYAQLLSGSGSGTTVTTNTYRAPLRRGLCVIVDFADRLLEDWDGPGMQRVEDVRAQLDEMEAHWDWLSRGVELAGWDIVRIQLAQDLTDTAFDGWIAFREEIVRRTFDEVDLADHDVDGDGVLDAIWAVVASGGTAPPYAGGGRSQHLGANIFVDGQDTDSVVAGATGNFNHEFAHTLELPDLYGRYDTVGDLSVMAGSWPLPPNDFTAYERVRLGWVEPLVIDRTMLGVVVPSANDHLFAIRIPTARAEEYFLLEYRQRPASGYGSAGFDHDGLAVWHVLEDSSQSIDPPLLKLEPADGVTAANYLPEIDDLAAPENPDLRDPLVLRTYFGGGPVFQLENVRRSGGAMVVDVILRDPGPDSPPNLIANSTVESGTGGWWTWGWMAGAGTFGWANIGAGGSTHSLLLASTSENDLEWATTVSGVVPDRGHQLCAYLRGEDVTGGAGAGLSVHWTFVHSAPLYGTFDWTRRCKVVAEADGVIDAACRLGGFTATTSGTMWCDDITLVELDSAFAAPPP